MAFFSLEGTPFKTWLVANMKIWGFVPALIMWLLALLLVAWIKPDAEIDILTYGFLAAVSSSVIFTSAQESESPVLCYVVLLLLPFVLLIGHAIGKISAPFLTTGVVIWLWISLAISLYVASVISKYAKANFDDMMDRLFHLRSSVLEYYESETKVVFMRFVEAFLFSFISLGVFAQLFS